MRGFRQLVISRAYKPTLRLFGFTHFPLINENRKPSLSVEINPVDAGGSRTKRRGLIIRSVDELLEFKDILSNDKVETLLEMLEDVNPGVSEFKQSKEVIEI